MELERKIAQWSICLLLLLLFSPPLDCQAAGQPDPSNLTLKSKVRVLLVDITVTDRNDQPVKGLPKDAFEVFENG